MLGTQLFTGAQGHTLVELLLILTLIAVVLHAIPGAYAVMQRTTITTEQENQSMQRFEAMYHHMRPLVSVAGFYGCASEKSLPELVVHGAIPHSGLSRRAVVTLYSAMGTGWSPRLPTILENKPAPGTDVIQLEGAGPWFLQLAGPISQPFGIIPLDILPPPAEWFVISDCRHVELFTGDPVQVDGLRGIRPRHALHHTYDPSAVLAPWTIQAFYLDKQAQTSGYTLNRKSLLPSDPATGLISGIESWRLSIEDNILQVEVQAAEPLTLWMRLDHAA